MNEKQVIDEFRANGGRVGGFLSHLTLLLLTTTGARTGHDRVTPLTYKQTADGRYVVIAAAGGADRHPGWYHNLVAQPQVTLEVGDESFTATAAIASGPDRDRLWHEFLTDNPQLQGYADRTARDIPVVALTRAA